MISWVQIWETAINLQSFVKPVPLTGKQVLFTYSKRESNPVPVTASTSSSGGGLWYATSVNGENGVLVFRFKPNMKLCTWKKSVLGVHLHNLSRLQVSIKWTCQSTFPARPSLVLNNAESLKSDVNIRWPQLAWAVRWYSSSASVFSLPPEHER